MVGSLRPWYKYGAEQPYILLDFHGYIRDFVQRSCGSSLALLCSSTNSAGLPQGATSSNGGTKSHQGLCCNIIDFHVKLVDPLQFAVLGQDGPFRSSSFTEFFNPTNTTPPFFQAFDPDFFDILGPNPSIRVVASNPGFAFAHEAPIWDKSTNELSFASNDGGPLGFSDIDHNNVVSKISLDEVAKSIKASNSLTSALNVTVTPVRVRLDVLHDSFINALFSWYFPKQFR